MPRKTKGMVRQSAYIWIAYFYDENEGRYTEIEIKKALVMCSAGHTLKHLEEIVIEGSLKVIMLNDRLLGVGVGEARIKFLEG